MIALRSYGIDAEVWRHDPPRGERDPLISCPGSYQPHKGGPVAPSGTLAVQPALPHVEEALFDFDAEDDEAGAVPVLLTAA